MGLSKEQIARYSRQLILPEIGLRGQERLAAASALLIGAGGLGSPVALYLAAAGIGRLGLLDPEPVALSNLHRQLLYTTADLDRPKTEAARRELQARNPHVSIQAMPERITAVNARALVRAYDLTIDGSDNFPTRYLVNDACVLERRPLVHGGAIHFGGQVLTIQPGRSACLRCVFPEPPAPGAIPGCQEAGVLGSAAGVIGTLMAHEALKVLLGLGAPLTDRLAVFEGLASRWREVPLRRDPGCPVCGDAPTIGDVMTEENTICASEAQSAFRAQKSERV